MFKAQTHEPITQKILSMATALCNYIFYIYFFLFFSNKCSWKGPRAQSDTVKMVGQFKT